MSKNQPKQKESVSQRLRYHNDQKQNRSQFLNLFKEIKGGNKSVIRGKEDFKNK
jgi:hypothetical protein